MRSALFAFALIAAPAFAQMPTTPPGAPDLSRAVAGTYKVDGAHSQVLFTLNHLGFSEYTGQFVEPTGTLVLDPANPANDKVDITFPIAKVSTTVAPLNAHLQKPEFFDSAQFPDGHFVSTKVTVSGKTATIAGELTLKGVTKPVTLAVRFVGAGSNFMTKKAAIGFSATTTIKRSEFGVSYGIPIVSDEVKLTINAAFDQQ